MIKKVMITLVAGLVAFAVGMVGLYVAMPRLAPERVVEARSLLDSLARSETAPADPPPGGQDLTEQDLTEQDLTVLPPAGVPDSLAEKGPDAAALQIAFADSLRILRQRLQETTEARTRLEEELVALRQGQAEAKARRAEAGELSSTLAKLEDRELQALLAKLDMDVLDLIYRASSGRNRTRLLQALAPDRAARFVQDLVRSDTPEADGSETEPAALQ